MSLFPQADAAALGVKLAIIGAIAVVVVGLAWRCNALGKDLAAAGREVDRLSGEVQRADLVVTQAKTVNDALRAAVLRQNADIEAAKATVAKLEAESRAARARLASDQAAARETDSARRARLDKPSAAEMNAVLRGVVGAM